MSTTFTSVSNDVLRQVGVVETLTGATTLTAELLLHGLLKQLQTKFKVVLS